MSLKYCHSELVSAPAEGERSWSDWLVLVCVGVVLFLLIYVGSYFWLAEPTLYGVFGPFPLELWNAEQCDVRYCRGDRLNATLTLIFAPANKVDRTLFPRRWPNKYVEGD